MIEIGQVEQLLAVSKYGTLSKAAEALHISQPALSRAMQKLEEELQVPIFDREKNRITLNATGKVAVDYAQKVLFSANDMIARVREYNRMTHTISIGACAPAPLWDLVPYAGKIYENMAVSSEIKMPDILLSGLENDLYTAVVLNKIPESKELYYELYDTETLYFSLAPDHPLADSKALFFKNLDGQTMLLYSRIGVWYPMHLETQPHTHFILQDNREVFMDLTQNSTLPTFISDLSIERDGKPDNRKIIPIIDKEATNSFYFVCKKKNKKLLEPLYRAVEKRLEKKKK
ncbi:LysR family transcriptional regulator [Catenibacterium mitsuokai]|uniref:LysR family transcriptional regulator n=1 Tax=Catenibacterium mitsuokai TaxID=100886 RepID=UPI002E791F15|nr:LysR family transcriptional regulator [Catenibacterium tridentinum]